MVEKEKAGCKNGLTHTEIPPGEVVVVLFGRNRFGGEMSRCVHGGEGSVLAARTGNCLGGKGSRCVGTPVDRKFNDTSRNCLVHMNFSILYELPINNSF